MIVTMELTSQGDIKIRALCGAVHQALMVLLNSCSVTCSAAVPQRDDDDEQRKAKLQFTQANSKGTTWVEHKAESADNLRDRKSSTQSSSQRGMGSSLKAYAGVAPPEVLDLQ